MGDDPATAQDARLDVDAAWIAPILGRGGKLMYMGPILKTLADRTRNLKAVVAEYGGDTEQTGFETIVTGGVFRFYRPDPGGYARGFTIMGPSLFLALCRIKPDLLIINEFSMTSLYGLLSRLCNHNARVLLIVETRPWSTRRGVLGLVKDTLRRYIASRSDAVLTNNSAGKDYVCDDLGVPAERVVARPYLVSTMNDEKTDAAPDLSRFDNLTDGDTVEFLYVGEVIRRKGLQQAIVAFSELPEPQRSRFIFNIVGDGPDMAAIEDTAKSLGIDDRIVFHGRQEYEDLKDYYNRAHVFLFPTHRDYRALAPFEALSMGLPVLASAHDGGACETVSSGKNGFTFDPFDETGLGALLNDIIAAPGQLTGFARESCAMSRPYTLTSAVDTIITACNLAMTPDRGRR